MNIRGGLVRVIVVGLALASGGRAESQIVFEKETEAKLARQVSVTLADTTLQKALSALSAQTGLTIQAEPYLQNRTLTVQLDKTSATNALNALAELGGWQWIETDKGVLRFARKRLRVPAEPIAIPRLMQNAVPLDLRDYLGIRAPNEDLTRLLSGATLGGRESYLDTRAFNGRRARLLDVFGRELFASIKPDDIDGKPIQYSDMTRAQREYVMGVLLGLTLRADVSDLLHYDLWPHVANPISTELALQGTLLSIQTHIIRTDGSEIMRGYDVSVQAP